MSKLKSVYELLVERVNSNKDCRVVAFIGNGVIIAKRIKVEVNRVNNASYFMNKERKEDKTYCVMAILKYKADSKGCYDTKPLEDLECPVLMVHGLESVDRVLEDLR